MSQAACGMPVTLCVPCGVVDSIATPAPYVCHGVSMCARHVAVWVDPAMFIKPTNPGENHV